MWRKNKILNRTGIALIIATATFSMNLIFQNWQNRLDIKWIGFHTGFKHPSDVIEFDNKLWITELLSNRIVALDELATGKIIQIEPNSKQRSISSPHFLATNEQQLFVSAGWGSSIYGLDKYNNYKITKYPSDTLKSKGFKLSAPHGVCVKDNWLYIADSLNSRLVRIHLVIPEKAEIFSDKEKMVAYGRQLLCREDGIWLSNSYEKRPGLNTGQGSNVLLIKDFTSGISETITSLTNTNITGINIVKNRFLIIAKWHQKDVSIYDLHKQILLDKALQAPAASAGPPYGVYFSKTNKRLYITYIGDIFNKTTSGGIAEYRVY